MSRYIRIASKFWTDEKTIKLPEDARFLFLYMLTSPHSNMVGYYYLPKLYICHDMGWEMERFAKAFTKLLEEGLIYYCENTSVILVPNFLKYNLIQNKNQAVGAVKAVQELPTNTLFPLFIQCLKRFAKPFTKPFEEAFPERYANTETETETEYRNRSTETGGGSGGNNETEKPQPESPNNYSEKLKNTTSEEREILSVLKSIELYPFNFAKDLQFIRDLATDYPYLDLLYQVKKWRDYKRDKPLTKKSSPRAQLRNWMNKANEWRDEKGGGKIRADTVGCSARADPAGKYREFVRSEVS